MRFVVIAVILLVFALLNYLTARALIAAHPRWRKAIWIIVAFANIFWLFLPFVLSVRLNGFARFIRATLGPVWFSWLIFIILYLAFAVIIGAAWLATRPFRRVRFGDFARWPSRVFLTLLGILALIGWYQAVVPLRVEPVPITVANLPPEFEGYRIALMCDLHVGLFTKNGRLEEMSRAINAANVDMTAIVGDLIDDDPYFIPKFLRGLDGIEGLIVATLGNHEMYGDPKEVIRRMQAAKMKLLVNEGMVVTRGSGTIWFAGLSDYAATEIRRHPDLAPDFERSLAGRPDGAFTILLAHQPKAFPEAIKRRIPLTLCGHTHGGQFGIRPLGWSLAGVFLKYHIGLYREGDSQLYVNTGTGYWLVPVRLGMTPEITVVELRRARVSLNEE